MIKKILFLLFLITLSQSGAAQCTPDGSITSPTFTPTSLADAYTGISYNQVIQFKVLKDTVIIGNAATVQSAVLNNVTGLPSGLSYACNKSPGACTYNALENGCITLYGTPAMGSEKSYAVSLAMTFNASIGGGATTPISYNVPVTLNVLAGGPSSVSVAKGPYFSLQQRENELVLLNPASGKLSYAIFDMLGREMKRGYLQVTKGDATSIEVSGLEKGIYFVNMQLNNKQETIKISKGFY